MEVRTRYNSEYNSIEVFFGRKPSLAICQALKESGFVWNNKLRIWYAKKNKNTLHLAVQIIQGKTKGFEYDKVRASAPNYDGVSVGDIFYCLWNNRIWSNSLFPISFYQVVGTTNNSIRFREIDYTESHGTYRPSADNFVSSDAIGAVRNRHGQYKINTRYLIPVKESEVTLA